MDYSHLNAIDERLYIMESRLRAARSEHERQHYARAVERIRKERADECRFRGIEDFDASGLSESDLSAELEG